MRNNFVCNIPYSKTENCIVISARDWVDKRDSELITKGQVTNIQSVQGVGYTEVFNTHSLLVGDEVLLTKVASKIAYLRPYELPDDSRLYANVHQMQIIGKFNRDNTLELFYNKLRLGMISIPYQGLITGDDSYCAFEVLDVGSHAFTDDWTPKPLEVEKDMLVLVNEHDCTTWGDGCYYVEESKVVGYFDGELTLDCLVPLSTKILLKPKEYENKTGSLFNPYVDLDVEDISEVYDRDRFEVIGISEEITTVHKGDLISVGRDYLRSIKFLGQEYFIADSDEYIRGVLCPSVLQRSL